MPEQYSLATWNNQHIANVGTDYAKAVVAAKAEAAARGEAVKLVADCGDGYPESRMISADGNVNRHWGDARKCEERMRDAKKAGEE